jgi:hypothetical protein
LPRRAADRKIAPEVTPMSEDRRRRRSNDHAEALALLLESCRERTGLDALVIADHDGLLVSASTRPGKTVDPVVIAAHLPRTHWRDLIPALHARTFKLGGVRLFLGAVGNLSERMVADLLNAMRGTQRILA